MRCPTRAGRLALAALAVVAVAFGVGPAGAGHESSGVTSLTGCLAPGGSLVALAAGDQPAKPCTTNQVAVHLSGGDITAVVAGAGLTGGGTNGAVSLGIDTTAIQQRVTGSCQAGQFLTAVHADGTVACATDQNTTYAAGTGLALSGTTFSMAGPFRLPQGCGTNQVAKFDGSAWSCAADADTLYSGADFALSNRQCPAGRLQAGVDAAGLPVCSPLPSGIPDLHVHRKVFVPELDLPSGFTTVASLTLPAGSWHVTGLVEIANANDLFGQDNSREVLCALDGGGVRGGDSGTVHGKGGIHLQPLEVFPLPSGGPVRLECRGEFPTNNALKVVSARIFASAVNPVVVP